MLQACPAMGGACACDQCGFKQPLQCLLLRRRKSAECIAAHPHAYCSSARHPSAG